MNGDYKIKLFTKYLNRYFRREERIMDWSYIFNGDNIDIQIDYEYKYNNIDLHQTKRISFMILFEIPESEIERFSRSVARDFNYDYEKATLEKFDKENI